MPTILICDDERDIVSALEIYLHAEGYETAAAYNGREALDLLHRRACYTIRFPQRVIAAISGDFRDSPRSWRP